jgi:hypothetical protein
MEAPGEDERRAAPIPQPSSRELSSKDEPEEGHKEHGEVLGRMNQVTQRMLVGGRSHLRRRGALMEVVRRDVLSRAKVQRAEDPMTQQERDHEEEREQPAAR